jgi:hypothetical protein
MKKFISILLAVLLVTTGVVMLASCTSKETTAASTGEPTSAPSEVTTTASTTDTNASSSTDTSLSNATDTTVTTNPAEPEAELVAAYAGSYIRTTAFTFKYSTYVELYDDGSAFIAIGFTAAGMAATYVQYVGTYVATPVDETEEDAIYGSLTITYTPDEAEAAVTITANYTEGVEVVGFKPVIVGTTVVGGDGFTLYPVGPNSIEVADEDVTSAPTLIFAGNFLRESAMGVSRYGAVVYLFEDGSIILDLGMNGSTLVQYKGTYTITAATGDEVLDTLTITYFAWDGGDDNALSETPVVITALIDADRTEISHLNPKFTASTPAIGGDGITAILLGGTDTDAEDAE